MGLEVAEHGSFANRRIPPQTNLDLADCGHDPAWHNRLVRESVNLQGDASQYAVPVGDIAVG